MKVNEHITVLPDDFDWEFYLELYEDLRRAGFSTEEDAKLHYLTYGIKENRVYKRIAIPENFDWLGYILFNPYLLIYDHITENKVIQYYTEYGHKQNLLYKVAENQDKAEKVEHTIYLFYHIWAKNNWYEIVQDQINKIKTAGLWKQLTKIFVNIAGSESDALLLSDLLYEKKVCIYRVENNFEFPTLGQIKDVSAKENFKGIYIHAKSVSYSVNHPEKWKNEFWRNLMDDQILINWRSCYEKIKTYDLVGTLFKNGNTDIEEYWNHFSEIKDDSFRFTDHFSGNFYWFDSRYFSKIRDLTSKEKINRHNAEWYPFLAKPTYFNTFRNAEYWKNVLHEKINPDVNSNWSKTEFEDYTIIKNHTIEKFDVSVIISLYNYRNYLRKAVESVMCDESKPLTEIVIVNDCSTDDSLIIAKLLLNTNHCITIIDKSKNTGLIDTRNTGILNCLGEFVFILDTDNTIYPGCLKKHYDFLRLNPDHIACYATIACYDEQNNLIRHVSNREFDFEELKKANYIDAMAMFNKEQLLEIGIYDDEMRKVGIGWEDFELWLRIGNLDKKVGFIEENLSRYLVKENSMLSLTDKELNKKSLVNYLNMKFGADIQ